MKTPSKAIRRGQKRLTELLTEAKRNRGLQIMVTANLCSIYVLNNKLRQDLELLAAYQHKTKTVQNITEEHYNSIVGNPANKLWNPEQGCMYGDCFVFRDLTKSKPCYIMVQIC